MTRHAIRSIARVPHVAGLAALALATGLAIVEPTAAQQIPPSVLNPDDAEVRVLPIRGSLYMLTGAGGNVTASVGVDGVFLVDSGPAQASREILAAIARIQRALEIRGELVSRPSIRGGAETESRMPYHPSMNRNAMPKPIRHIVNTHAHPDHVGGNAALMASGVTYTSGNVAGAIGDAGEGAAIMAHENVLLELAGADKAFEALPTLTYFEGQYKYRTYFNGEGIRLVHMQNAHTNGDTIVHFRNSDVVATGDLFSTESFPVIDVDTGGHIDGIIDALNDMIDLAIPEFRTEGGTMFVPGHGRLADSADVTYYRDMLTIVRDRIRHLMDQGLSLNEVQAADPTFGYNAQWGSDSGVWTTDMFVEAVYSNLEGGT